MSADFDLANAQGHLVSVTAWLILTSPHTYAEMKARGRTDSELVAILEHVHLAYLPGREGGWETRKEWKDVLSGGEKQRMGMARLL